MILDSGTMWVCTLENAAENGAMPHEVLKPYARHWFQERTIGMNRLYLAKGVNERIDLLAYVHMDRRIRAGHFCVLGNGEQFRVDLIDHVIEENTNLQYTRLTLRRLDENYDVYYGREQAAQSR